MAKWAAKHNIKRVYTVVSDYAPGHDAEKQFIKTFKAAGGVIVNSVRIPLRTTDYAPFLERVRQAKPDAVYMMMPAGPPSINTVKAWADRGLKAAGIKLLGSGEVQEIYFPTFGPSAEGIVSALHYTENLDNPQNKALKATLKKMYGRKAMPDIASIGAWDAMNLIYDAVRALGPKAKGKAVVKFMEGRSYQSPRGPITIDAKERDVIQNIYIRRVVKKNGKLINQNIDVMKNVRDPWKVDHPLKK
jgi:branched-chain amino acid transport system substrate-binding protein